jgi:hypothetical protein
MAAACGTMEFIHIARSDRFKYACMLAIRGISVYLTIGNNFQFRPVWGISKRKQKNIPEKSGESE